MSMFNSAVQNWKVDSLNPSVPLNIVQHAIGGKLIKTTVSISDPEYATTKDTEDLKMVIRKSVAEQLAEGMLENNLINVTIQRDLLDMGYKVRAYCYLAPDSQVRILREMSK